MGKGQPDPLVRGHPQPFFRLRLEIRWAQRIRRRSFTSERTVCVSAKRWSGPDMRSDRLRGAGRYPYCVAQSPGPRPEDLGLCVGRDRELVWWEAWGIDVWAGLLTGTPTHMLTSKEFGMISSKESMFQSSNWLGRSGICGNPRSTSVNQHFHQL